MNYSRLAGIDIGVPFVVPTIRYLLPGRKDPALRLHWHVLTHAFPARPRWQWYLLLLAQTLIWFGFMAWWRILQLIRYYPMADITRQGFGVSKQLTDLLYLALICGVDPSAYYELRLYDWPRLRWMDFVYPQETMNWHAVLSCKPGSPSIAVLRDKRALVEYLAPRGVPCVNTLKYIPKGTRLQLSELMRQKSLFLKPNAGHGMRGCAELNYDSQNKSYRLRSANPWEKLDVASGAEIEAVINGRAEVEDYLVQPLLVNHDQIDSLFNADQLVTIRVISAVIDGVPAIICATAEIPNPEVGWIFLPLNCRTGNVEVSEGELPASLGKYGTETDHELADSTVPFWQETCSLVIRAHTEFKDLLTVAWDLAVTGNGPCIIEGNTSWNIVAMQTSSGIPALRTGLMKAYKAVD